MDSSTTDAPTEPMITLHPDPKSEQSPTPVIAVTWSFTNELVNEIKDNDFRDPHLVLVAGYETVDHYGYQTITRFTATKVYHKSLTDGPPKEYLQFSTAGNNVVIGFVVDFDNQWVARDVASIANHPDHFIVNYDDELGSYNDISAGGILHPLGLFDWRVHIDKNMFAPEPSATAKRLVSQFTRIRSFDQCDFRRQLLIAIGLSIPVQIYGLFARVFTLFYALVMAKRDMQFKLLFALNPHDFIHATNDSFWLKKYGEYGNYKRRTGLLPRLTPPWLFVYAGTAAAILLPGFVVTFFSHLVTVGDGKNKHTVLHGFTFVDVLKNTPIADAWVLAFVAAIFIFVLIITPDGRGLLRDTAAKLQRKEPAEATEVDVISVLEQRVSNGTMLRPAQVENTTFHLKFQDLKTKVCKPFARH